MVCWLASCGSPQSTQGAERRNVHLRWPPRDRRNGLAAPKEMGGVLHDYHDSWLHSAWGVRAEQASTISKIGVLIVNIAILRLFGCAGSPRGNRELRQSFVCASASARRITWD